MTQQNKYGKVLSTSNSPTHTIVDFQVEDWEHCNIGKFVTIPKTIGEEFIAVITSPHVHTEEYSDPALVKFYTQRGRDPAHVLPNIGSYLYLSARIIGLWDGENLKFDGSVPKPGTDVLQISENKLKQIFRLDAGEIFLGHLFFYPDIEVRLRTQIFMREHSAVFGVTRSGKSYTSGVILEELIKINSPVLIIDPHGEYHSLGQPNDVPAEVEKLNSIGLDPRLFNIQEFSPPSFVDTEQGEREITVNFSDLTAAEIIELTGFSGENQQALIFETARTLQGIDYTINHFLNIAERNNGQLSLNVNMGVIRARVEILQRRGIFGNGFVPSELINTNQVSIINLSGLDKNTQQITVAALLRRIFRARTYGDIPYFSLFIEEAHRFAPSSSDPISKSTVEEIAKEGGKFGISLHIVSQRPSEVSNTLLSQCETKIFHKLIEVPDVNYARSVLGVASPELAESVPNLSVGSAIIMGGITNYQPIYTLIRPRQSRHGGGTAQVRLRRRRGGGERPPPAEPEEDIDVTRENRQPSLFDF
ncbi:MAG TPA: ATP-binding protein [Candidatus Methanoperedens sp.]